MTVSEGPVMDHQVIRDDELFLLLQLIVIVKLCMAKKSNT